MICAVFKDHATSSLGIQEVTTQGNAFSRVSVFISTFDIFRIPLEPVGRASTERTSNQRDTQIFELDSVKEFKLLLRSSLMQWKNNLNASW